MRADSSSLRRHAASAQTFAPTVRSAPSGATLDERLDALIFNHTPKTVYDGTWTAVERASRGLTIHSPRAARLALRCPTFFTGQ
jgi:hypothetical protein